MKVKFSVSVGMCEKAAVFRVQDLGYTNREWKELPEDDKWRECDAWGQNHIGWDMREIPEDGDDEQEDEE